MSKTSLIVLLTDFGSVDPYAGILKGVISQIAPGIPVMDLTHEIPPGDVLRAAIFLWQSRRFFPVETVFLCVVDPGVGTNRRGILLRSNLQTFIGPDNGIFSYVISPEDQVWELTEQEYMLPNLSSTFHGRDVFAPVAAYAALGVEADAFGLRINQPLNIPPPTLVETGDGRLEGEVLYSDRFGNVLTSLGRFVEISTGRYSIEPWVYIQSKQGLSLIYLADRDFLWLPSGEKLRWVGTFANLERGECGFLVGSSGLLEIVANGTRADQVLTLLPHDPIILGTSGK